MSLRPTKPAAAPGRLNTVLTAGVQAKAPTTPLVPLATGVKADAHPSFRPVVVKVVFGTKALLDDDSEVGAMSKKTIEKSALRDGDKFLYMEMTNVGMFDHLGQMSEAVYDRIEDIVTGVLKQQRRDKEAAAGITTDEGDLGGTLHSQRNMYLYGCARSRSEARALWWPEEPLSDPYAVARDFFNGFDTVDDLLKTVVPLLVDGDPEGHIKVKAPKFKDLEARDLYFSAAYSVSKTTKGEDAYATLTLTRLKT
tara:strand:- start:642 stop:1400 length:759 start_codon:yes stop_codon:yes gene_type:complete